MPSFDANDYVYLDWAATAPLCEEAALAMAPYQVPGRANLAVGGNANSLHAPGRAAFAALEDARRSLARDLGASRPDEIVLMSGATEPTMRRCSALPARPPPSAAAVAAATSCRMS